jgi:hypothetical protein
MLHDSILLRGVRGGEMMLDTFVGAVGDELLSDELVVVVRAQHPQRAPDLELCRCLDLLDGCGSIALGVDDLDPHEPCGIIHQQKEESSIACCRYCDQPA